ncbi:fasciclin domain-containing protein [Marivirga arenosa]|uniref:Fasciclin domain-containing protein n=1 Tax=Marivirga arenosa TaxID=3059076 RepID=A0AA49GGI0_9BACT|nr:fasciclin domain-containing protein [Marivirga sp. ABR2-2]WKK87175.2 fasciclin domain-containing protein [Marivirga sp. ABR2-2]
MKRRDVILFIGIIVASIIGTKTFANHATLATNEIGDEEARRIIKKIKNNPEFSLFYKALEQADLKSEIAALEELTLMIPTNKAFRLLPKDVLENFMDEENKDALIELLNYHILPQKINYEELGESSTLNALDKQQISVKSGAIIQVENAEVQAKYEETNDLIIYKIDRLIMPLN